MGLLTQLQDEADTLERRTQVQVDRVNRKQNELKNLIGPDSEIVDRYNTAYELYDASKVKTSDGNDMARIKGALDPIPAGYNSITGQTTQAYTPTFEMMYAVDAEGNTDPLMAMKEIEDFYIAQRKAGQFGGTLPYENAPFNQVIAGGGLPTMVQSDQARINAIRESQFGEDVPAAPPSSWSLGDPADALSEIIAYTGGIRFDSVTPLDSSGAATDVDYLVNRWSTDPRNAEFGVRPETPQVNYDAMKLQAPTIGSGIDLSQLFTPEYTRQFNELLASGADAEDRYVKEHGLFWTPTYESLDVEGARAASERIKPHEDKIEAYNNLVERTEKKAERENERLQTAIDFNKRNLAEDQYAMNTPQQGSVFDQNMAGVFTSIADWLHT